MRNLATRLRDIAERQAGHRARSMKSQIIERLPEAEISLHGGGDLVIVGQALRRCWLHDAALRFLGRSSA